MKNIFNFVLSILLGIGELLLGMFGFIAIIVIPLGFVFLLAYLGDIIGVWFPITLLLVIYGIYEASKNYYKKHRTTLEQKIAEEEEKI